MSNNPFDDDRLCGARSAMIKMTPDEQGRFEFELWCQYTRMGLHSFQVGDLVAVESYTPPDSESHYYSILTLTQVYPIHFAAQGTDAYPGHIFESMRSIKEDWVKQGDKPLHPTTTIIANAVSTGLQIKYDEYKSSETLPSLEDEKDLPMVGAEIRPLSVEMVNAIINKEMEDQPDSPFTHKKFNEINIKLDKDALLTTHFGIFGFTGVGKSNLVSSMVSSLVSCSEESNPERTANVIIIDPNDEYLGLLIDKFVSSPNEIRYIHVGTDSLPLPIIRVLGQEREAYPEELINLLLRQMKLPRRLKNDQEIQGFLRQGLINVLARARIALPAQNLASWIQKEIKSQTPNQAGPDVRDVLSDLEQVWIEPFYGQSLITANLVNEAIARSVQILRQIPQRLQGPKINTANGVIDRTVRSLNRFMTSLQEIPSNGIISNSELIETLNDKSRHQMIIITGRRDSDLKLFAEILGNELYESRRREGQSEPSTVFLFDEADLFIPIDTKNEETARIKEFCVTLARRGRKFGLGIGISTQRASLLDTEVMGNLHTYFVSKLPRAGDRQRIAEAFGIGDDQLAPTFTFRPGDWLIISHDATGLKGVPIPSYADDANERIIRAAGDEEQ